MPGVVAAFHVFDMSSHSIYIWALGDKVLTRLGDVKMVQMGAAPHRGQRGNVADGCLHQQTQLNRTNV